MKTQKNKFILTTVLCLAILACSFLGFFAQKKVNASDTYTLSIERVICPVTIDDKRDSSFGYEYVVQELDLSKVDVMMLHNADQGTMLRDDRGVAEEDKYYILNKKTNCYECISGGTATPVPADKVEETFGTTSFKTTTTKEYFKVSFTPNENSVFEFLSVNAFLNDTSIDTKEVTGQETKDYVQYYDLLDTDIDTNSNKENYLSEFDAQGRYTFTFKFMINVNGTVEPETTVNASFYAISEYYYINPNTVFTEAEGINPRDNVADISNAQFPYKDVTQNESQIDVTKLTYNKVYNNNKVNDNLKNENSNSIPTNHAKTEPRIENIERIDRQFYQLANTYPNEKAFFNFSNQSTINYDGVKQENANDLQEIKYPTIIYDASKYYVTYTQLLYGVSKTTTSKFSIDVNGTGKVTLLTTGSNGTETKEFLTDSNFVVEIPLYDLGAYNISFDYVVKDGSKYIQLNTTTLPSGEMQQTKQENWNIVGDVELYIYGYKLNYSVYKNESGPLDAEFIDLENNLYADVTNKNINGDQIAGIAINSAKQPSYTFADSLVVRDTVVSTNQAPLFFKYFAGLVQNTVKSFSYYNLYDNSQKNTLIKEKQYINSSSRFTENGYYEVFLVYNFSNYEYLNGNGNIPADSSTASKVQVFAFTVANVEPEITLLTYDAETGNTTPFTANGFTNKSVKMQWDTSNKFNVLPEITVSAQEFGEGKTAVDVTSKYNSTFKDGTLVVSDSALYIIKIEYGPCYYDSVARKFVYSASIVYKFTIDKTPIDDIFFHQTNKLNDRYIVQSDVVNDTITSSYFTVTYGLSKEKIDIDGTQVDSIARDGKKLSGATISASYTFLPITATSTRKIVSNEENNQIIANGSAVSSINKNLSYSQIFENEISGQTNNYVEVSSQNDVNSILTNDGIYIFYFEDMAGNKATKFVIIDKSSPVVMQTLDGENYTCITGKETNIVNQDTKVLFGKYKAILLPNTLANQINNSADDTTLAEMLTKLGSSIYSSDSDTANRYLLVEIKKIVVNVNDTQDSSKSFAVTFENITFASNLMIYAKNDQSVYTDEKIYDFTITDKNKNSSIAEVEMNFDKSQLQAHIDGTATKFNQIIGKTDKTPSTSISVNNVRVKPNTASNRQKITFDWLENAGTEYEIESINCEFYPLSYDVGSDNYPYASAPTETINLLQNVSIKLINDQQKQTSGYINLQQNSDYGTNETASRAGMYKIVRKYKTNVEGNGSQDKTQRDYYFYIDRNNIITYADSNLIGRDIEIRMNYDNQNVRKVFKAEQFLQEFASAEVLNTDKLPVSINRPATKYENSTKNIHSNKHLNIIKLNYTIVNEDLGKEVFNSTTDTTLALTENGTYRVTISDNTGRDSQTSFGSVEATNIEFKFTIKLEEPKIYLADQNDISNDAPTPSFNTTEIKAVWDEDEEGYKSNIDQNNITITKTTVNGAVTTLYKIVDGAIAPESKLKTKLNITDRRKDNVTWAYEIDLSALETINEDCKYQITVQYEGKESDYGSKFRSTKTLYFDFTAPEYNFKKLLSADKLLSGEQKQNFENYNSAINFENYAFTVSDSFYLEYAPADDFWSVNDIGGYNMNDVDTAWFRKYDKYSSSNLGTSMQSIVPGDERYSNKDVAPQRLRFDENLKVDGKLAYTLIGTLSDPLNTIAKLGGGEGYYEIIERDCAGNYRIYTIKVLLSNDLSVEYDISKYNEADDTYVFTPTDPMTITSSNISEEHAINNKQIDIKQLDNISDWATITVQNNSTKNATTSETINLAPITLDGYMTYENAIAKLNELIAPSNSEDGDYFTITIRSQALDVFTIAYRTPGKEFVIEYTQLNQHLNVKIDQAQSQSTYLTEFYVYEAVDGKYDMTTPLENDDSKAIVSTNLDENTVYEYTFSYTTASGGRNLRFVAIDNFGRSLQITDKYLGITEVAYENIVTFNTNSVTKETVSTEKKENMRDDHYFVCYVDGEAYMNIQPKIFNDIKVVKEDTEIDITALPKKENADKTITYTLFNSGVDDADIKYIITMKDAAGYNYKYEVHYFSKLANVDFVDSSGIVHDELKEQDSIEKVSRTIYIRFNKAETIFETFVSGTRTYFDELGNKMTESLGKIVSGEKSAELSKYGTYTIVLNNQLGTQKVYTFEIKQSVATYYSVVVKPDGINSEELEVSDIKYDYNGTQIDQYFTIYDYEIDVNETKGLMKPTEAEKGEFTTIWLIKSQDGATPYEKYIAITKVEPTNNLLQDNMTVNGDVTTSRTANPRTSVVTVSMPAYNNAPGNKIIVKMVYNSTYSSIIDDYQLSDDGKTMTMEFTECGVYNLYISDIAGNQHLFQNTRYFTLYVLNNINYTLNGERGVQNSVFNKQVTLQISSQQFVSNGFGQYVSSVAVNSYLNGKEYYPSRSSGSYVYSDYGTYVVYLTVGNAAENTVITTAKFTIFNPNEARVAYEYIGLNGYEVVSVVKDNIDITNEIREKLNMMTLTSLAITGGENAVGGNGHYTITVKVTDSKILPSKTFSYNVWINSDINALILCSLAEGESTTKSIYLQLNLYQIYQSIGECYVRLNGNNFITIDESTAGANQVSTYELNSNMRYNVTLETKSGNTLVSFVVTKAEPLNTVAIIVIVVVTVVVVGLTVTFILLRKKMKIK